MKMIWDNIKDVCKKFLRAYKNCMELYGEAVLRGGSYGC
jgi:hypothetical protein